ncbi:MAG: efflux RND transporter periplasmic adaptor subunit [Polyangiaceae bacterium]
MLGRRSLLSRAAAVAVVAALAGGGLWLARHRSSTAHGEDADDVVTEVPVRTAAVTRATLHRYVEAFGSVTPDAAHDGLPPAGTHLAAPIAGVLAKMSCSEGDHVEAGAPLFQLDARAASAEEQKAAAAVAPTRAALARLKLNVDHAQLECDRTKRMQTQGLASDKDVREAELVLSSAKEDLAEAEAKTSEAQTTLQATHVARSLTTVRAPLAGTVVRIHVSPGETVDATTVLADIVDLSRLVVTAQIPAAELSLLKPGQVVDLDADAHKDPARAATLGSLAFVGLDVDPKTDTGLVRASIPKDAPLRPGQHVRIRIAVEEHANVLAVPEAGVVNVPDVGPVIAILDGDTAKQRPVEVGLRENGLVEVKADGLTEGTKIVTEGAYGLPRETRVRVLGE